MLNFNMFMISMYRIARTMNFLRLGVHWAPDAPSSRSRSDTIPAPISIFRFHEISRAGLASSRPRLALWFHTHWPHCIGQKGANSISLGRLIIRWLAWLTVAGTKESTRCWGDLGWNRSSFPTSSTGANTAMVLQSARGTAPRRPCHFSHFKKRQLLYSSVYICCTPSDHLEIPGHFVHLECRASSSQVCPPPNVSLDHLFALATEVWVVELPNLAHRALLIPMEVHTASHVLLLEPNSLQDLHHPKSLPVLPCLQDWLFANVADPFHRWNQKPHSRGCGSRRNAWHENARRNKGIWHTTVQVLSRMMLRWSAPSYLHAKKKQKLT